MAFMTILVGLFLLVSFTSANVEKVIFLAPEPIPIPQTNPSLSSLALETLTHANSSVRTELSRSFPRLNEIIGAAENGPGDKGDSSWFLLDDLTFGQRYELRICWAAIEPTAFTLDVYDLDTVFSSPPLIQSLSTYSYSRQSSSESQSSAPPSLSEEERKSVLLLHIQSAADYFTDDKSLMRNPPPVLVDVILDPFLLNLVPTSLIPTAGYLLIVAAITWVVARRVANALTTFAASEDSETTKDSKKKQ